MNYRWLCDICAVPHRWDTGGSVRRFACDGERGAEGKVDWRDRCPSFDGRNDE